MDTKLMNLSYRGITLLLLAALLIGILPKGALAAPGDTTRISVDSSGAQANNWSRRNTISGDGRYVAFMSDASNLVSGDTNGNGDIFVHDRQTGITTRVSVDASGTEANGGSDAPTISSNGRYVAFSSYASNLVSGDANGMVDIFVHDRQTGDTTRVSIDSSGTESNGESDEYNVGLSGDGRYVVFASDATNLVSGDNNGVGDIFVHDRQTGATTRVSVASNGVEANAGSGAADISNNGRYVAFASGATNLVVEDMNGQGDIFVRDLQTGSTTRVSVNTSGDQADEGGNAPEISGDGRYVVFLSNSDNLAPMTDDYNKPLVYVHDRQIGQTTLASAYSDGEIMVTGILGPPTISKNGRYVAFSFYDKGDNNGISNIWVRDLQMGNSRLTAYGNESSYGPSLSDDGSIVNFWSYASNLVSGDSNGAPDIFVNEITYGPDRDPTVVSVTPACGWYTNQCPYPTPSSVSFIVIFSEQVTGVTLDDLSLEVIGNITGASITGVSGYGTEYIVTVDTGTSEGRLRLNVLDDDSIKDSNLNPLGGAGVGNGDFTTGRSYLVDKSNPFVTGIVRADPNPSAAENVGFSVTFNENVSGVDASHFSLAVNGSISGASVTAVSGSDNLYMVTVATGTGDGTLRLDLNDDDSIRDQIDNPLGGDGGGNGSFSTGEVYTVTKSTPTVTASLRSSPSPTLAANVNFVVTFSEQVSGVETSDFSLTTSGGVTGASVASVSGSGDAYVITVDTGTGDGSLRLDVLDDDSIVDTEAIPLGGIGVGNGNFISGESYMIDKTIPIVTGSLRNDSDPTAGNTVNFSVVFSEAVSGVDVNDFFLMTTGNISGASVIHLSGSGNVYTITTSTGSGDGTLRLDILDDDSITDVSSYPLGGLGFGNGNFTTGEVYTINKIPRIKITETFKSNGKNDGWVLESSENSDQGGYTDPRSPTIVLGDDSRNAQFRSILHFPTYYLPNNAVITRVLLMIKRQALVGTDPFETHQNIVVDIRSGAFGYIGPFPYRGLQISDFESPSSRDAVGVIENNPFNGWYWSYLDSSAIEHINRYGITQIRLRFQVDDNDDMGNNYLRFFSGDYNEVSDRPRLLVEYYQP